MTLGIAIQGNGWAVLAADSKVISYPASGGDSYSWSHCKIYPAGPFVWVTWAGCGVTLDASWDSLPYKDYGERPKIDMNKTGRMVFKAVQEAHEADAARLPSWDVAKFPDVLFVVKGSEEPPRVAWATRDVVIDPVPGHSVVVGVGQDESPMVSPDNLAEGRQAAIDWLTREIRTDKGRRADFPLHLLTVELNRARLETIESASATLAA